MAIAFAFTSEIQVVDEQSRLDLWDSGSVLHRHSNHDLTKRPQMMLVGEL